MVLLFKHITYFHFCIISSLSPGAILQSEAALGQKASKVVENQGATSTSVRKGSHSSSGSQISKEVRIIKKYIIINVVVIVNIIVKFLV